MDNIKQMLEVEIPNLIAMQERIKGIAENAIMSIDMSKASPSDRARFDEAMNKLNKVKEEHGIINNG